MGDVNDKIKVDKTSLGTPGGTFIGYQINNVYCKICTATYKQKREGWFCKECNTKIKFGKYWAYIIDEL